MYLRNETPPLNGNFRNGGSVFSEVIAPSEYRNPPHSAKEIAARIVAARFSLPVHTARVVCELAGIGGKANS